MQDYFYTVRITKTREEKTAVGRDMKDVARALGMKLDDIVYIHKVRLLKAAENGQHDDTAGAGLCSPPRS